MKIRLPSFSLKKKDEKKDNFWRIVGIIYTVFFLAEAVEIIFRQYEFTVFGLPWNWGWALFFFQVLYTGLCLRTVGPTEWGALLLFGKPVRQLDSGLTFVPRPFYSLIKETKLIIQLELPGEPEQIERADQDKPGDKKKIPIRITHASLETAVHPETGNPLNEEQKKGLVNDPLIQRLTSEVSFIVRYKIKDYLKFLSTIGSSEEASRQISDTVILTGQTELAKITLAHAFIYLESISRKIRNSVEYLVGEISREYLEKKTDERAGIDDHKKDSWGIDVEDASIKLVDTGRRVNEKMADATAAGFGKRETIQKAEGEEERLTREGRGTANARQSLLEAEAKGLAALAKATSDEAGRLVLHLKTVQTALEKSKYSIFSGSDTMAAIAAIHETWEKVVSKEPKESK